MTSLTVLVVDDELPALEDLAFLLRADERIAAVLTAADAADALRLLDSADVDAVFLDIRMPGLSGLEMARVLSRFTAPPAVVFVTAYDGHAVDAFALGAVDYLMKPVRAERLADAVGRLARATGKGADAAPSGPGNEMIPVELGGTVRFVSRNDVRYVEAHGDYARLHTAVANHLVRVPLATLEEQWAAAGFVRVHRSYLVGISHIEELRFDGEHYEVRVAGRLLPVSRRHSRELKDRLVRGARPS